MKENREVTDINVGDIEEVLKKFSTSKRIKMYELLRIFKREGIENFVTTRKKYVDVILSDYKRVLKENEEKTTILLAGAEKVKQLEKENKKLKEDRNNNIEMVALARNEVLNYMTGYEDGKKHKMTATAQVVENQQYYIIQKQMGKYEEHIKRLQKENEELKGDLKYVLNQTLGAFEKNWCIDWNFTEIREKYNLESE